INYYYGLPNENIGSFDQDRINWEINGLVGITLARNQKDKRTMLAAFGTLGFNNAQTTSKLIQDQKYTSSSTKQSHINNYYQLEGGLIIDEILRISTGVGQQNFQTQTLTSSDGVQTQKNHLTYQVTTIGFQLDLGKVWWTIDCHIAYQKDFTNTIIIPKTGLLFQF
ncbi:MAG: hypothetical protein IRZ29_07845, partial [Thermoflavifilum sp.]|nr:hypothetical protein [Thermoflavifilum sp.]